LIRAAVLLLTLASAGCMIRSDDQVAARLKTWMGRPVSEYAFEKSRTPTSTVDQPDGKRVFIFERGGCGTTIWAVKSAPNYVIHSLSSTCAPGYE
jgi:hypothetical protein